MGLLAALAGLLLLAASACSKPATLPPLNPVHGKVVFEDGRPVSGGSVRFDPLKEPTVTTTGVIGPDGTFVLKSFKVGVLSTGATAGPHRVVVNFADPTIPAFEYPKSFVVKPGDNEFTLTIPKRPR
jgi:hypothetical protein